MGVQNLQKQLRVVRPAASDLPSQAETAPALDPAAPVRARREIGDLRVREDIAQVIGAALPEGSTLEEDRVTLCAVSIRFHRVVKGKQFVALLYFDEGFEELTYQSWFLSSVCLRIFTTTKGFYLEPAVEIIARSGLLPEDWRDELDACVNARIARSKRITRIEPWLAGGPESALPQVKVWIREMGLQRDDSQNERGDSFGQTAKPGSGDDRAVAAGHADVERARRRRAPLVFISYSHHPDDKMLFDKLKRVLNTLNDIPQYRTDERRRAVWTDEEIKTSDYWKDSIEEAIDSARVVVALVTPSFLNSEFIKNVELKPTLERVRKKEKKVAWVPGADCPYDIYGLDDLQAACDPNQPLNDLDPGPLDKLLNDVRKKVQGLLDEILAKEPD